MENRSSAISELLQLLQTEPEMPDNDNDIGDLNDMYRPSPEQREYREAEIQQERADREEFRNQTMQFLSSIAQQFTQALAEVTQRNNASLEVISQTLASIIQDQKSSKSEMMGELKKIIDGISAPKTITHTRDGDGNIISSTTKIG